MSKKQVNHNDLNEKPKLSLWQRFVNHPLLPKAVVLLFLIGLLWLLKPLFNLIMMTLFLTILTGQIALFVKKYLRIPTPITILALYSSLLGSVGWLIYRYWHVALKQLSQGFNNVIGFYSVKPNTPIKFFNNVGFISSNTQYQILHLFQRWHLNTYLATLPKSVVSHLSDVIGFSADIVLAIVLSFLITMDLPVLIKFNQHFYHSKLPKFFNLVFELLHQFIKSFSIAIDTQLIISIVNMLITTIGLYFLGFSNLWLMAIMVWALSLIPVAGALLSFIPLSIIGFAQGGLSNVFMVGLLLILVHLFESYVLNPQIMSNRTRLPVAYTFIALILGDMYLGIWGLLLAVPLMTFVLDFLGVQALPKSPKPNKTNPWLKLKNGLLKRFKS